jgi:hypothetical protein
VVRNAEDARVAKLGQLTEHDDFQVQVQDK